MRNCILISFMTLLCLVMNVQAQLLQIDGSTTVGPIADAFTEAFIETNPDIHITVKKTGSGNGAAALIEGRCDIATMSRFMKDKEYKNAVANKVFPVAHAVAMDGVCMVVHPSNQVKELSIEQIKDIYLGKITNWKQLGGSDLDIIPISRDTSSGTFETFHTLVMKGENLADGVEMVTSNPQAHTRVKTTQGSIAYVGLGFVDSHVSVIKVNGITPNRNTISSGSYPIARPLFMFTNGYPQPGSLLYKFCTFYLTEKGQEIIEDKGFIPFTSY